MGRYAFSVDRTSDEPYDLAIEAAQKAQRVFRIVLTSVPTSFASVLLYEYCKDRVSKQYDNYKDFINDHNFGHLTLSDVVKFILSDDPESNNQLPIIVVNLDEVAHALKFSGAGLVRQLLHEIITCSECFFIVILTSTNAIKVDEVALYSGCPIVLPLLTPPHMCQVLKDLTKRCCKELQDAQSEDTRLEVTRLVTNELVHEISAKPYEDLASSPLLRSLNHL